MNIIATIKRYLHHTAKTAKMSEEIRAGIENQSALMNRKMNELIDGVRHLNHTISRSILNGATQEQLTNLELVQTQRVASAGSVNDGWQAPPQSTWAGHASTVENETFETVLKKHPLMFARKTYNTNHPDYNAELARNFPGKIFNMNNDLGNPVYAELKKMIKGDEIAESRWSTILRECLEEARSVPHAEQVFERKAFVEKYMEELEAKYGAYYKPGWVNLDDALFLYWVVRMLKPKAIVQTGVCNGLSSAFMMLALAKNGPEGTLHVVDMPPIFDSSDDNWKIKGKVYGVVIPEGKSSGWLVPDAYRDRYEVLNGDAKDLLPGLLKKVGSIDMFYHDSDHTYDHMMFEFIESKKYLTKRGVIVSDDISWNSSLWDFADEYKAPSYNYRGSMGITCF